VPKAMSSSFRMAPPDYDPELIWVMGYPYTGPGVTLKIIEFGTNKSMATNYGDHLEDYDGEEYVAQHEAFPIDPIKYPNGPFWHNMDQDRDSPVLLVKTHCGGTCMHEEGVNCTAAEYIGEVSDYHTWREACRVGRGFKPKITSTYRRLQEKTTPAIESSEADELAENGSRRRLVLKTLQKRTPAKAGTRQRTAPYPITKVKKAILNVRNPFVIIASRFRHYGKFDEYYRDRYFNAAGLKMWCEKIDEQHKVLPEFESHRDKTNLIGNVPCWTELFRLANWYKFACRMLNKGFEYEVVHFEDYTRAPEATVDRILKFAGLKFVQGKWIRFGQYSPVYKWFTEDQLISMARYMEAIMKPECVEPLFRQYFADGWINDMSVTNNWGH